MIRSFQFNYFQTALICFCSLFISQLTSAQDQLNLSLFGQLNPPGEIRHSGSWGYTNANGNEYAILGSRQGSHYISIDDASNIEDLDFVEGPESNWREITVIGDHAFITSEGTGPLAGMQVVDLSDLPNSVNLVTTYTTGFDNAHIIQRDIYTEDPFVYVMGSNSGVHILDVSDPANPTEIGFYGPYYIHDVHVRGDRMYAAAIFEGQMDIVDISDKSNPTKIGEISHGASFTHSAWTSENNTHLIVTDETDGLPARIYNIEDPTDPEEVAQFSSNLESLVHNPYTLGDVVFVSHNTEGLRIYDIKDPGFPIEVGYYDTWLGSSGGFNGLWSAYPYFPSGKIIGGNRHDGLYIWEYDGTLAGRVYGNVVDSETQEVLNDVSLELTGSDESTTTDFFGNYRLGTLPGSYAIEVELNGYFSQSIPVDLESGDSITIDIELIPLNVGIDEINMEAIQVYPQPSNSVIYIDLNSDLSAFNHTLYSTLGQRIGEDQFNLEQVSATSLQLMVDKLDPGIYFLKIRDEHNVISIRLLVE